jgi:amino acid transporter
MWYAFARDGGMPGSRWIRRVSTRTQAPVTAVLVTSVLAVGISIYAAAFTVITSISTIALYLAYGIPIYLNLRNRARGRGEFTTPATAPWSLGRLGQPLGWIALVWVLLISILFSLPPNELVLWTLLLVALILGAYWLLRSRHRFRGPAVSDRGGRS